MIIRNGIRSTLRARGRTALFTALILVLTLSLSLGLGMWAYCGRTLAEMDQRYTSVALLEYLGGDYPDGDAADEYARQAFDALDGGAASAVSGVKLWESNDRALASMEGYTRTEGNIPYGDRAVLTVFNLMARYDYGEVGADALPERYLALDQFHMTCRLHVDGLLTGDDELPLFSQIEQVTGELLWIPTEPDQDTYFYITHQGECGLVTPEGNIDLTDRVGTDIPYYFYYPDRDTYMGTEKIIVGYDAIVSNCLYSLEGRDGIAVTIETGDSGFVGEKGKSYLIHGKFVETGASNRTIALTDFYEGCGTKPYAELSGYDDPLLTDSLFTQYADYYRTANNYVALEASDDIAALEVFQQGYLTLREGRFPGAGEAGVCVIDGALADARELTVGDSIELTLMTSAEDDRYGLTVTGDVRTLTVVGVTNPLKEYQGSVWVSSAEGNFGGPFFGYQLGRAVLDNGKARQAADALQAMAPDGVRVTLYDQGYSAAAQPLEAMKTTALAVTLASACGALAVLFLFAYLFIGRQRETVSVLVSLGTPAGKIRLWLLSGGAVVSGTAAVLGALLGGLTLRRMIAMALSAARNLYAADQRYSEAAVGVVLEQAEDISAPLWPAVAAGAVVLAVALLLSLFFLGQARKQTAPKRGKISVRVPKSGTSTALGGPLRFAFLSACRGGWRSAVVPAAALVLALFLGILAGTAQGWSRQTAALYENTDITGQAVSTNGRRNTGLLVSAETARTLWKSGMLSDISVSLGWNYWLSDEIPVFSSTSFGQERRKAWIASQPKVVALNSLDAAPAYMNSQTPEVEWLADGDESILSDPDFGPFYHSLYPGSGGLYGDAPQTTPCIAGREFMDAHGLSLGDAFTVNISWTLMTETQESSIILLIVGSVNQTGGEADLYVPLSFWGDPAWITGETDVMAPGERPDLRFTTREEMEKYFYSLTNFSTCTFTLKSSYELEPFRNYLADKNFSWVGAMTSNRTTLLLRDQSFTETVGSLGRYITFSRILFPALFVMVGLLGFIISWLMVNGRRMEFAVMRGLGASRSRVFLSFFLEQGGLCLAGCLAAGIILTCAGQATAGWLAVAGFLCCYLAGCALSVLAVGKTHLMSLLSERE